jgi:drug/metabolite transporter (DMT)-like permease
MNPSRAAVWRLILATMAWGLSFPTAKAIMLAQALAVPGRSGVFHAGLVLWVRMIFAALLMGLIFWRHVRGLRGSEIRQGVELGLYGGVGMLLQTDAQHVIPASTSAFFTQFTCIFVPLVVALRSRMFPSVWVVAASGMVLAGCAVLSGVQLGSLGFGPGEWETIAAAGLFTGQILVLERQKYRGNEMRGTAFVMFAMKALVLTPVVFGDAITVAVSGGGGFGALCHQIIDVYTSPSTLVMTLLITVFSTAYGYATMIFWQPMVSSVQAGIIYATEPIFATGWALFLPGLFSAAGGFDYPNESVSAAFCWGAALILGANLLLLRPQNPPVEAGNA